MKLPNFLEKIISSPGIKKKISLLLIVGLSGVAIAYSGFTIVAMVMNKNPKEQGFGAMLAARSGQAVKSTSASVTPLAPIPATATLPAVQPPQGMGTPQESDSKAAMPSAVKPPATVEAPTPIQRQDSYMNPFEFASDRTIAQKKKDRLSELEIAELEAKIREANLRGREKAGSGRTVSLPPIDTMPKMTAVPRSQIPLLQEDQRRDQRSVTGPATPAQPRVAKVKIPGVAGVVINGKSRSVILDDGNAYETGAQVAEGLFLDRIAGSSEVYFKDILGNIFRAKSTSYDAQVLLPLQKG